MQKLSALLFLLLVAASSSNAKDFGVAGKVWPITEVDIRRLLVEDAAKVDWTKPQKELQDNAEKYVDNLPKRRLGSPDKTETRWVDPSVVLSSDIQAPVKQADGSIVWQILVPKGTKVNPLEKFRPATAFLLFDGADPAQLKLVREVLAQENTRIIPVEAGAGNVTANNDALRRNTYYANDTMLARFQVRYLPSLVYPGFGPREYYLGTTSYGIPYKVDEVLQTWPSLGFTPKPAENSPK
jgi:conjugal transfer pilus assembly protein TraW